MGDDPYRILGVGRNATPAEVRAAFRRRVRQRHPDTTTQSSDDAAVRDLIAAYHTLVDPAARARFDAAHPVPDTVAPQAEVSGQSGPMRRRQTGTTDLCSSCAGSGRAHGPQTCPACGGSAEVTVLDSGPARILRCSMCRGAGRIGRAGVCRTCGGLGRVRYEV